MAETKKNTNTRKNSSDKKNNKNNRKTTNNSKKIEVKENKKVETKIEVKEENKKTKENFFKKNLTDIILIAAAVIVVVVGAIVISNNKEAVSDDFLKELSYKEYEEMIKSGETFAFIVESATCVHCQNFMPIVKKFVNKKEVPVYYIDLANISNNDYEKLTKSNSFFVENADNWGTPTTIILQGEKVLDTLIGETTEENFQAFLEKNGLMG